MEIFRVTKSVYGQETLIGVSWQLFWWFAGAALLFVAVHMIYKWFYGPMGKTMRRAPTINRMKEIPPSLKG